LLKTNDWQRVAQDLSTTYGVQGESPDFFDHDAVVIDFSQLPEDQTVKDMGPLLDALRSCGLIPVALRGASPQWRQAARALGLVEAPIELVRTRNLPVVHTADDVQTPEPVQEAVAEVKTERSRFSTMVVDKPLRSGQKIYAKGSDLVLLAMVNQGAEVVADGNIHVYAPLRGKAMAGASGNTQARIFSLCLDPELISIAGVYRTSEHALAADIQGKPAQVRLSSDGQDKLIFEALNS
jgi:septum site-determining protein MinC